MSGMNFSRTNIRHRHRMSRSPVSSSTRQLSSDVSEGDPRQPPFNQRRRQTTIRPVATTPQRRLFSTVVASVTNFLFAFPRWACGPRHRPLLRRAHSQRSYIPRVQCVVPASTRARAVTGCRATVEGLNLQKVGVYTSYDAHVAQISQREWPAAHYVSATMDCNCSCRGP